MSLKAQDYLACPPGTLIRLPTASCHRPATEPCTIRAASHGSPSPHSGVRGTPPGGILGVTRSLPGSILYSVRRSLLGLCHIPGTSGCVRWGRGAGLCPCSLLAGHMLSPHLPSRLTARLNPCPASAQQLLSAAFPDRAVAILSTES